MTNLSANSVELVFEGLPPLPNTTRGAHWSRIYKEAQLWKTHAYYLAKSAYHGEPFARAHLHYHFSVGSNRIIDPDNLVGSIKHLNDGLKGVIIKDDDIDSVELEFSFDREKPKSIRLTITALP